MKTPGQATGYGIESDGSGSYVRRTLVVYHGRMRRFVPFPAMQFTRRRTLFQKPPLSPGMPTRDESKKLHTYRNVDQPDPDEKPPEEWHYTERRAYILDQIFEKGTPLKLNQSSLADTFDVDPSTISRDVDKLRHAFEDSVGAHAKMRTQAAFEKIFDNLLTAARGPDGDWRAEARAWEMLMEWNEWLEDRGIQDKAAEKHKHEHSNADESDMWVVQDTGDDVAEGPYETGAPDDHADE